MSVLDPTQLDEVEGPDGDRLDAGQKDEKKKGHSGHGHWLMMACCVPMLAIAVALVASGVVGAGFIVAAVGCTLMMGAMMVGMSRGGG